VCGYPGLLDPPYDDVSGGGSDEICPCCGTQFGYDDFSGDDPVLRRQRWTSLRERWVAAGMAWWSKSRPPPPGWDPSNQLRRGF
jgi:hypothetical protein